MGITTVDFFEYLYGVLFAPNDFFKKQDISCSVRLAIGVVCFVSIFCSLTQGVFNGTIFNTFFIFTIIGNLIGFLFIWFFMGLFFEYVAKIFDRSGNLGKILFYSAFSTFPYIFSAPLNLLKNIDSFGYILSSVLEFLLYIWIIILYAFALSAVYKITISRAFMLIFLPMVGLFFAMYHMVYFFSKLCYIFSM